MPNWPAWRPPIHIQPATYPRVSQEMKKLVDPAGDAGDAIARKKLEEQLARVLEAEESQSAEISPAGSRRVFARMLAC